MRLPRLCVHVPTQRYYIRIKRKTYYVGKVGGPEEETAAEAERLRVLAEHRSGKPAAKPTSRLTIADLLADYDRYCVSRYKRPDGSPSPELQCARLALRPLLRLYGRTPIAEFTPDRFEILRDKVANGSWMTPEDRARSTRRPGWCRAFINKNLKRIKLALRWGMKQGFVPVDLHARLAAVEGLRAGQGGARETKRVGPAPEEAIEAVRCRVCPMVRDMIDLQLLTGARPGEICSMTPGDFDRTGERVRELLGISVHLGKAWAYLPRSHKTLSQGKTRVVPIGPKAQAILKKYLDRPDDKPLFSPAESREQRYADMRAARKSKVQPSQEDRKKAGAARQPRDHWTVASYSHTVILACQARQAGKRRQGRPAVQHWHPHMLRHNAATRLEREFGYETARIVCGHEHVATTHVYVATNLEKGFQAIEKAG